MLNIKSTTQAKAFTLVEMIVVIVIIMILAGLAAVSFNALIGETRENVAELTAVNSARNLDALAALNGVSPQDFANDPANAAIIENEAEVAGGTGLAVSYAADAGGDNIFTFTYDEGTENEVVVTIDPGDSIGAKSAVAVQP